jgi:DEAD/DEAH box helicase domain-containing protein
MPDLNVADIVDILASSGLPALETVTIEGTQATYLPVPEGLHSDVKAELTRTYPSGLYSHQSEAIRSVILGQDICLATPTASGKSLVFMAAAANMILADRSSRVLALYPAKALIRDQLTKWERFLQPFGIKVGFIDGSVPTNERPRILAECGVIAMTPDVAHAWLMSHLSTREVSQFMGALRLLVLDEAHVYDGAFGTNMGYFLRRFSWAVGSYQVICSTATIGAPENFMQQLTGRNMEVIDAGRDGSAVAEKTLILTRSIGKGGFDRVVTLLGLLAKYGKARFLAFGDSRKAVERIVGAVLRQSSPAGRDEDGDDGDEADGEDDLMPWPKLEHVLPFRAGYEASDREAIQKALTEGSLAGVVSTSALELGMDIGDLDIVVLINTPPAIKSFRQRIGRAGRRRPAVCILIDDQATMSPLPAYLERQAEPSWLYLENRYIQYSNALCAAAEFQATGRRSTVGVDLTGLPESFPRLLDNELNPTTAVDPDLYGLKQRAQGNPHYEFPIRSAAEPNFDVKGPFELPLGNLSYGQALREAYPGAVYYYMARPFRIQSLDYKKGQIRASKSRHYSTKALADTMAFPDFKNGLISAWKAPEGFVAEVELQVSERVKGFIEQRGQSKLPPHEYGPGSPYRQSPLIRAFKTTGICWTFPAHLERSEAVANLIMRSFAFTCGVHERDLGVALFHANQGPFSPDQAKGAVIFDATNGSLRLTERLGRQFSSVVDFAIELAEAGSQARTDLTTLAQLARGLELASQVSVSEPGAAEGDWISVIGRNQPALHHHANGPVEVVVLDFRYTPHGVMYQLEPLKGPGYTQQPDRAITKNAPMKWMVLASLVEPLPGRTQMVRYNVVTGEEIDEPAVGERS